MDWLLTQLWYGSLELARAVRLFIEPVFITFRDLFRAFKNDN